MKLIVGLGNPGDKYAGVRHNLGFEVADDFIKKMDGGKWKIDVEDRSWKMEEKFKAEIIRLNYTLNAIPYTLILAKPQTFMNNSGLAVRKLADYYKVVSEDIIIIQDELDLPLGKIKVRLGGAAAGHHGVESIIEKLGTDKFIRVRLGIGNIKTQSSEHKQISLSAEKFVLETFTHSEKPKVKHMIKSALKAIDLLIEKGLESTQNQFN